MIFEMCDGRDILSIKPPLGQFFYLKTLYREVYGKSVESVTQKTECLKNKGLEVSA